MAKKLLDKLKFNAREAIQNDARAKQEQVKQKQLAKKYEQALKDKEATQKRLAALEALDTRKPVKPLTTKATKGQKPHATAIVVFSDWHVGETVDPRKVSYLNEYNLEIAKQRSEAVTRRALTMIEDSRGLATVDTLVVALLGDFITGWIHEELAQTNALAPPMEVFYASELIERSLRTLLEQSGCKRVHVVTCVGNHGRMTHKTQAANRNETSYEYLMYRNVAKFIGNDPRITWDHGEGYVAYAEIGKQRVRFMHGDSIKFQGGVGGITIPVMKSILRRNVGPKKSHYDIIGDKHTFTPGLNWHCNGSMIGYSTYAEFKGFEYQEPLQSFCLMDHERGMVCVKKLFCD
jgi:hypothetical protein